MSKTGTSKRAIGLRELADGASQYPMQAEYHPRDAALNPAFTAGNRGSRMLTVTGAGRTIDRTAAKSLCTVPD